ncbi:hypothetical protein H4R21_002537, partial [Coemansia helicoidea]
NVATYGSVISYCLYWAALAAVLVAMRIKESRNDRRAAASAAVDSDLARVAELAAVSKRDPLSPAHA